MYATNVTSLCSINSYSQPMYSNKTYAKFRTKTEEIYKKNGIPWHLFYILSHHTHKIFKEKKTHTHIQNGCLEKFANKIDNLPFVLLYNRRLIPSPNLC